MKADHLRLLIQAGNPIIAFETPDEPRVAELIRTTAESLGLPLYEWSVTEGLRQSPREGGAVLAEAGKPQLALRQVKEGGRAAIYLFKDLGGHCRDPATARFLRDLYFVPGSRLWTLILLDALPLPAEIRRLTVAVDVGWPDEDELLTVVRETFREVKRQSLVEVVSRLTHRELQQMVQTLRGLTADEAARVVSAAILDDHVLDGADLARVMDAKRNRLRTAGCLESIIADVSPEEIGGLRNLKRWLHQRRNGFSPRARQFGLDPPRGILLLGVQGCGKSLCAKVVASAWCMPLLRMDPGVLYQKFVGESEARLREALGQAESMAPAVLWIDEIEKAFASASAASTDGGLSQRMFGTLLSWMQDHRHPIFLIATANNIEQLPPELMRKGRFDEIFFVDLPGPEDRAAILQIHLQKRGRDPAQFDVGRLAAATEGFTGAELEQAIIAGLYRAFAEEVACETTHILASVEETYPISVVMGERITALRRWSQGRCVSAD